MTQLTDPFGRVHNTLRLSVTDRCNLRCTYCMPVEGVDCRPREELMSFEDITFTLGVARQLGIDRVRITGGEPLLRKGLAELIGMIRDEIQLHDVAMTTNGLLLERRAAGLADAGLDRLNISLDSLHSDRFAQITRFGDLHTVTRGLHEAVAVGLTPVKLNALVLEGFNDDEFDEWVGITADADVTIRFMELMPIGEATRKQNLGGFVNLTDVRRDLADRHGLIPVDPDIGNGPARYWRLPNGRGKLGFITPMSNPYCNSCSRMRLTATGQLRACLADDSQVDLSDAIERRDIDGVIAGFQTAVAGKPAGHNWNDDEVTESEMSALGG